MFEEPFPYCCGISVIGEFNDFWTDIPTQKDRVDGVKSILKSAGHGAVMATLVDKQKKEGWGRALETCGFREVKSFRNPNSGNRVTVYWKDPTRKRKSR